MEEDLTISPAVFREVLEKLGPTFIKFGQILSLRADVVGEEISQELSKLQDNAPAFSYQEAEKIIEEELGNPKDIFKFFDKNPIAAASLSQVYKAVLKSGEEVAVKVQRPGIDKIILEDIHILSYIAKLLQNRLPESKPYQPVKVVSEFADWTMRELDFRIEGHNMERFRFSFKNNPNIKIPCVYWKYTASRVLTMEFSHGIKADDLSGMKKLNIDRKKVARNGTDAMLQQFLIDGFFHADPHPGNFFIMKNGALCLHDCGMVGYLNENQRKELISCVVAFVDKDMEAYSKHFMHLTIVNEESDVEGFQKDLSDTLNELFYSPQQLSIALVFFKSINKGARHNISFPADMVLFGKAIITAEAMGLKIDPEFNFNEQFQLFIPKVWKAYFSPKKIFQNLKKDIFDYQEVIQNLPLKIRDVLERLDKHEIGIKIDASDLRGLKKELNRENNLRIVGMILTALLLVIIGISYLEGKRFVFGISLNSILMGIFIAAFIWFLFRLRQPKKN